jgi:hypothetical protein
MKGSEKRQLLQEAFGGKGNALRQLQRQRLKTNMPFLEVTGIILVDACPVELMGLSVVDTESCIDSSVVKTQPLSEFIDRWNRTDRKPFYGCAFGLLDPEDEQYDALPLSAIHIRHTDYSNTHTPNGTISELRRLFFRSQTSLSEYPFVPLLIETDIDRFNWDVYNRRRA